MGLHSAEETRLEEDLWADYQQCLEEKYLYAIYGIWQIFRIIRAIKYLNKVGGHLTCRLPTGHPTYSLEFAHTYSLENILPTNWRLY